MIDLPFMGRGPLFCNVEGASWSLWSGEGYGDCIDLPAMKLLAVAPEQGSGCLTQYDAMKGRDRLEMH